MKLIKLAVAWITAGIIALMVFEQVLMAWIQLAPVWLTVGVSVWLAAWVMFHVLVSGFRGWSGVEPLP